MNARLLCLSLALAGGSCTRPHASPLAPALTASLTSPGLGLGLTLGQPSRLSYDEGTRKFRSGFGGPGQLVQVGAHALLELDSKGSELTVIEPTSSASVKLRPLKGPAGFATWGPAVISGMNAIYPSADGSAAVVERPQASGVKEDLVLTRSLGDALRFEWALDLSPGLQARLEINGSITVTDANGQTRFQLPAPVVKQASGAEVVGAAHFVLGEMKEGTLALALEAQGLAGLAYPLSIDPTVLVTAAAELGRSGNLEESVDLDAAGALVRRGTSRLGCGAWANTTAFGAARREHQAVTANGYLYVIGGADDFGEFGDVEYAPIDASGAVGTFTTATNFFPVRRSHASVAYNGHLYVIGGINPVGATLSDVQVAPLAANGSVGAFTATTPLPASRALTSAVAWGGYLFVIGGTGAATVFVAPIRANGTLGAFTTTTTPLPAARGGHASVAYGGYLYVAGGNSGLNDVQVARLGSEGTLGAFTATSSFSGGRSGLGLVASRGALYVIGGGNSRDVQVAMIEGNGSLGPFSVTRPFADDRTGQASASWNDRLYVLGGQSATLGTFNDVQSAQLNGNGTLPGFTTFAMPVRRQHATVVLGTDVFVIGGLLNGTTETATVSYFGTTGAPTFSGTSPLPTARREHAAAAYNGFVYVAGGRTGLAVHDDVLVAPSLNPGPGLGSFVASPNKFSVAREGHALVAANGYLYVIGGYAGAIRRSDVQFAPINADGTIGVFSPTTSMNTNRTDLTAVAWAGRLYVIGGEQSGGSPVASVEVATINADGTLGAFSFTTPMNAPRFGHASVVHNGMLYVTGGNAGQNDVEVAPFFANGSLGPFVPSNSSAANRAQHTAASANGSLFLLGGDSAATSERAFINSAGNVGAAVASTPLATPRESHGSALVNGQFYVTGGFNGTTALADVQVAALSPGTGTPGAFTASSSLTTPRGRHTTVATSSSLYVLGGSNGTTALTEVLRAPVGSDGSLGPFAPTTPLPSAREGHSTVLWKRFLYVLGGRQGAVLSNTVWVAPLNPNGSLGAFTATSSFAGPREGHASVAYDGYVYVTGGNDPAVLSDVQRAPILANGDLGAFATITPLPRARSGHSLSARDGFLYVVGGSNGGYLRDVQVAPILSNGLLGHFWPSFPLAMGRSQHSAAIGDGFLYLVGGLGGASGLGDVLVAPLRTPASRGSYSRLITFPSPSTVVSITPNGSALQGELHVEYRAAPASGIFGSLVSRGAATLGTPVPVGTSGLTALWVRFTFDDSLSAVINADDPGPRDLTEFTVTYNPDPVLLPANPSTPPRGPLTFTCTGGSGAGYTFTLSSNLSGGSIGAGNYVAGNTGSVTDVVTCTDSAMAMASTSVTVTPAISVSPLTPVVPPRGARIFTATGGSMAGFTWTLPTNNSGGTISPAGAYQAGATGNVTDTVLVTDSLGNTRSTTVTVSAPLAVQPGTANAPPRGTVNFSTLGGSATGISWVAFTNASGMTIGPTTGVYRAGDVGGVTDVIRATDSLNNTSNASITVGPGVTLAPPSATVPPRGSQLFVPSGGSATGFTWNLTANASGGGVDGGAYRAGSTGNVSDVLQVSDSLGNVSSANITVTAGVSASPPSALVVPRGSQAFTASGGSNAGFTWSFQSTSASGGTLSSAGAYVAGPTGTVTDVLQVNDSLGNLATVNVSVSAGVSVSPPAASRPPRGTLTFTASGGSGTGYVWSFNTTGANGATLSASGDYVAGTLEGSDTVRVTDSLGNTALAVVTVTNRLSVTPDTVSLAPRAQRTFTGSGGSDAGFVWSLTTNNSGATFDAGAAWYQAGPLGGVTDVVRLTDSLNNSAIATITVGPGVLVSPSSPSTSPRGALTFSATGGSGQPFSWALQSNPSGATLGATGNYLAGSIGGVTDVVTATDSLGNVGTTSVTVGPSMSILPAMLSVAPRETAALSATGGSGAGFVWSFITNASGGTLNVGTGAYRAGAVGSVIDVVQATDSLGNVAQGNLTVTAAVSISPDAGMVPPRGTLQLSAMGGSQSGFSWTLTANRSGATLSPTSGLYQAGAVADVADDVRVVDSLGNSAAAVVNVTSQLAITPAMPRVVPLQNLTFVAMGGGGGNRWRLTVRGSLGTIDQLTGDYVAGAVGGTSDTVEVTDALGNVATTQVTVTPALSLMPTTVSLPPLGSQVFAAQGGDDGGYTFSVQVNLSGATIEAGSGVYQAGRNGQVVDVVQVVDARGATQTARVTVGQAVSISPARADVPAGGRQVFSAVGGSGAGYQWAVSTNASGGSIDATSGEYLAGPTGNVTDDVQVTDALGNVALARVTVAGGGGSIVPPAERPPANGWSCGCGAGDSSSGPLALLALGALFLQRRRRMRTGAVVACLLVLAPLSASAVPKKKKNPPSKVTPAVVAPPAPAPAPAPVVEVPQEEPPPVSPPPSAASRRPSIAVLEVEVTVPGEKLDAAAFSEMVVSAVDSAQTFKVISSKEIATMLGLERQRQLLGCSEDGACMTEIANALGSDFVMAASVGRVGENYLVTTRLLNGRTSKVTGRASVQAKSANSLLEAVWRATQQTLDSYGASLAPADAQAWAARPKPTPPATLIAVEETPSRFGISLAAAFGYQPLSTAGNRGSVGAQVDLTFRRGRLDLAAGVVIAPSPGARVTATWALTDQRARVDLGLRGSLFPGLGLYGGGLTSGFEFELTHHFALNARVAVEAYPVQGTVVIALLGAAGVSARF